MAEATLPLTMATTSVSRYSIGVLQELVRAAGIQFEITAEGAVCRSERIEGDDVAFRDDRDLPNDGPLGRVDQCHGHDERFTLAGISLRMQANRNRRRLLLRPEGHQWKEKDWQEPEHGGMIFSKKGFATAVPLA